MKRENALGTAARMIRFALWANQLRDQGLHLEVGRVMVRWEVSRATAYRWLAFYSDAMGFQWPRPPGVGITHRCKAQPGAAHPWSEQTAREIRARREPRQAMR